MSANSNSNRTGIHTGYRPLLQGLGIVIAANSFMLPYALALDAEESGRLNRCVAIDESAARLQCFDEFARAATQTVQGNTPAGAIATSAVAGAQTGVANVKDFGREHWESTRDTPESIEAAVVDVHNDAYGSLVLTLDNGQRWKQRGTERFRVDTGERIVIQRGTMSSFFLRKANGTRLVRFTRLE